MRTVSIDRGVRRAQRAPPRSCPGRLVLVPARKDARSLDRKNRGAYYTARQIADSLARWAIRDGGDRILDPSSGEGVFLAAAAQRIQALGGSGDQVFGIEVDRTAHAASRARAADAGIPSANVARGDFFVRPGRPDVDAVLGNPPYIRFQRFKGRPRERAEARAAEAGFDLSPLSSSWAPFVVHGAAFLRPGGRMALIVPREIAQANYGRDVLAHLAQTFGRVTLVACDERLFPGLDQDTLLLLARDHGAGLRDLRFAQAATVADLAAVESRAAQIDLEALLAGTQLRFWGLPSATRGAYRSLVEHPQVRPLAELATVSSGYVTGANDFFHLPPEQAEALGIPRAALVPAVFRAAALSGPHFEPADWADGAAHGAAGYLFRPSGEPSGAVAAYLAVGRERGVHQTYKARHRADWFRVPRVARPDLLLAAMTADAHVLAVNRAGVAAANTLHAVDLRAVDLRTVDSCAANGHDREYDRSWRAEALALTWLTSAAQLSRELEGRVLGGGMLKLEPGEAGRLHVPWPSGLDPRQEPARTAEIVSLLRARNLDAARHQADAWILGRVLGFSSAEIDALATAAEALRAQRRRRRVRP